MVHRKIGRLAKALLRRGLRRQARRRKQAIQRGLIVAPFLPGVGGLIGRAAPFVGRGALTLGKAIIPRSLPGKIALGSGGLIATGVALEDPRRLGRAARRLVTAPVELGRKIGRGEPVSIAEGLIKGGIVGAGIAGIIGAAALGKRAIGRRKEKAIVVTTPGQIVPAQVLPQQEPIGVVKQPEEEIKVKPMEQVIPTINTRINVSPIINIRFSKSRKFINQQILVRS